MTTTMIICLSVAAVIAMAVLAMAMDAKRALMNAMAILQYKPVRVACPNNQGFEAEVIDLLGQFGASASRLGWSVMGYDTVKLHLEEGAYCILIDSALYEEVEIDVKIVLIRDGQRHDAIGRCLAEPAAIVGMVAEFVRRVKAANG